MPRSTPPTTRSSLGALLVVVLVLAPAVAPALAAAPAESEGASALAEAFAAELTLPNQDGPRRHAEASATDGATLGEAYVDALRPGSHALEDLSASVEARLDGTAEARAAVGVATFADGLVTLEALRVLVVRGTADAPLVEGRLGRLTVAGVPVEADVVPHDTPVPIPNGRIILFEREARDGGVAVTGARVTMDDGTDVRLAHAFLPAAPSAAAEAEGLESGATGFASLTQPFSDGSAARAAVRGSGESRGSVAEDAVLLPTATVGAFRAEATGRVAPELAHERVDATLEDVTLLGGFIVIDSVRVETVATAGSNGGAGFVSVEPARVTVGGETREVRDGEVAVPHPSDPARTVGVLRLGSHGVDEDVDADSGTARVTAWALAVELVMRDDNPFGLDGGTVASLGRVDAFAESVLGVRLDVTVVPEAPVVHAGSFVNVVLEVANTGPTTVFDVEASMSVDTLAAVAAFEPCVVPRLDPGERASCVERIRVDEDSRVTATATGSDSRGRGADAVASALVDTVRPALAVVGDVSPDVVRAGEEVVVTLTVENVGDSRVTAIDVAHPLVRSPGPFDLAPGESVDLTARLVPESSATHAASAEGVDVIGAPVVASASTDVRVIRPAVAVVIGAPAFAHAGEPVTITLTVENVGDSQLGDVHVEEATLGAFRADGVLVPGESVSFAVETRIDEDATFAATATGIDETARAVDATAEARVRAIRPGLLVEASSSPSTVDAGTSATVTFTVRNSGDSELTNVTLSDDLFGELWSGGLVVGGETVVTRSFTPEATVHSDARTVASDPLGRAHGASTTWGIHVRHPALEAGLRLNAHVVEAGDAVTGSVIVNNTGDSPLVDLVVVGPDGAVLGTLASLDVGESDAFAFDLVAPDDDAILVAGATGESPSGRPVDASAFALLDVVHPALEVALRLSESVAREGDPIDATATVVNAGDATLTRVVVTASDGTPIRELDVLAPGESAEVPLSLVAPADDETVTATAVASTPTGRDIEATASALLDVIHPEIALVVHAPTDDVRRGTTVTLRYVVTNEGDAAVADVRVRDAVVGNVLAIARLDPGETATASRDVVVEDDLNHLALARGTDATGRAVDSEASVVVRVLDERFTGEGAPSMDVTRVDAPRRLLVGERGVLTFDVENTGDRSSNAYFLALRLVLTGSGLRAADAPAHVTLFDADGARLFEAEVEPVVATARHAGLDRTGTTTFETATWRLPDTTALPGGGRVRIAAPVEATGTGRAGYELYLPSTTDHPTAPFDSPYDLADATNLFVTDERWFPVHNSFDAWDDETSGPVKSHRWYQKGWSTFETRTAYAKARGSLVVDSEGASVAVGNPTLPI